MLVISKSNLLSITLLIFSLIWITFCDDQETISRSKSSSSKSSDSSQSTQTTSGESDGTPDSSCLMKDASEGSDLCTDYYNVQPAAVDSTREACSGGTYMKVHVPQNLVPILLVR